MKVSVIWRKIKSKIRTRDIESRDGNRPREVKEGGRLIHILLLTNRDSDNVGDQVIEACDISLLRCVMKNLGLEKTEYEISSRSASIVSKKYVATRDDKLLDAARRAIGKADLIVFGGAPMFNYLYQNFYERTAVMLELAQREQKPVIFSAIGLERYQEDNVKCQRLKAALNLDCVKQITTRDDFDMLEKFKENEQMAIGKVSDPAVFSDHVFAPFLLPKKGKQKKVIGIFILRDNGFKANKLDFSAGQAADFWAALIKELQARGYRYELLTSGHFSDEAFLDKLIRQYGVKEKNCIFNMNSPEKLVSRISSYDAVISCRLHPSIIAFALKVPSIGIVWNVKVKGFYKSIGYEDRIVEVEGLTPQAVVDRMERAMEQGVEKRDAYVMSVYQSLFDALRRQICPGGKAECYTYRQVLEEMPVYEGTSAKEQEEKDKRKYRRIYESYNKRGKP